MLGKFKGLVLSRIEIGEGDVLLTVLTGEHGAVPVYCHSVKKLNSPHLNSTQLLSYSDFSVYFSNGRYTLKESWLLEGFFPLRNSLPALSLAMYAADVASYIATEGEDGQALLRLTLNTLFASGRGEKPLLLIKGAFELRALSDAGFMPDLVACSSCGKDESPEYFFDVAGGSFFCESCYHSRESRIPRSELFINEAESIYPSLRLFSQLSPPVFRAMRHAVYSRPERVFAFSLTDDELVPFSSAAEKFAACQLGRDFDSLELFKSSL